VYLALVSSYEETSNNFFGKIEICQKLPAFFVENYEICAAGGQHEEHTITQTRSGRVSKTSANHRQHIVRDFLLKIIAILPIVMAK